MLATATLGSTALAGAPSFGPAMSFVELSASCAIQSSISVDVAVIPFSPGVGSSSFTLGIADQPSNLFIAANNATASLTAGITSVQAVPFNIALTGDLGKFPTSGALTIDLAPSMRTVNSSEILYFDGKSGQVLTITARAQDGTTAKTFAIGAVAEMRNVARHHNLIVETLIDVQTATLNRALLDHEHETADIIGLDASIDELEQALDENVAAIAGKVDKSGDTMTGPLILSGAPTLSTHAATKAYVDSVGALTGVYYVSSFNASGSATTTTGSITSGTNTLTVASASSFAVGQGIYIAGAGVAGVPRVTTITAIAGTLITLAANASATVSNVLVQHDDTVAIQTLINLITTYHHLTLIFDNGTYRINGPINPTSNSILTVPHSPYNQGIARTLRLFGQCTSMADVLSTPSPQGTIIQSDQTGTNSESSMFNLTAPYTGNDLNALFMAMNNLNVDIRDLYFRTHNNPRISAIDLLMGWNAFLTNVTVDTGHNPQGSLSDDSLAGAEPTYNTFGLRMPRICTLGQTNNVSVTNYAIGVIIYDLFHSISLFIQRCKTAVFTRGYDYPATGMFLIVQCHTGFHAEGSTFGRPGLDAIFKYEVDPRNLGHWWETPVGRFIYDPNDVVYGQLKYFVMSGYNPSGKGQAITVTGTTKLTKTNLWVP